MYVRQYSMALGALFLFAFAGCERTPDAPSDADGGYAPISMDSADLWDRQTTENAELLRAIADEFNAQHDGLPVKIVQSGNYGDIYRKTTAAIQAGALPAMAAAYGNMTVEYAEAGAVTHLDTYAADPETGLAETDWADFFPGVLEQNRYSRYGGALLSFPYTTSVLVMYVNRRVLQEAGIDSAPETWDAFLHQARTIKHRTGKFALCFDVDPSTIHGMIYSRGGDVLHDGRPSYSTDAARNTLALLAILFEEELAYQNPPRAYDDQTAFGNDEIAFAFRPSSSLPYFRLVMEGNDGWDVLPIPQATPDAPATVLYGANFTVFDTTPEHEQAAWAFLKFFTSPEITARWALGTGYLPCRRSATGDPALQAHWDAWRGNRVPFDQLEFARPEPNVPHWQEVRGLVTTAVVETITARKSVEQALADLQAAIDPLYE